nr:PAS domain S-box protein [Algoriphagus locisalis]
MSTETKYDWERLNSIFQALPLPTLVWQAEEGDFELIDYNEAAVGFLGDKLKKCKSIKASSFYENEPNILIDLKKSYREKSCIERVLAYGGGNSGQTNYITIKHIYVQPDIILVQIQEDDKPKEPKKVVLDQVKQLSVFIENSPAATAMFDTEMRYVAVSNKWLSDNKLEGKDLVGKSHYEVVPDIRKEWKIIHQRCLNGSIEKKDEDFFTRNDGSVEWIKWEVQPWYTEPDKIGGIIMFTEDITERKTKEELFKKMNEKLSAQNELLRQAKEKLQLNESRLVEAQYAAKIGSWETELSNLNVVWSAETFSIFELDSSVFNPSHESFLEYVHEEDKETVNSAFVNSFNSRAYHSIEHRIITGKGNLKYVEERWKVHKNKEGEPVRIFGSCQDITERKMIELELSSSKRKIIENEYRLKLAVDAAQLGVWDWNFLKNEVVWNSIMDEIHGLEKNFEGDKYEVWVNSLHAEDKEKVIAKLKNSIDSLENLHSSYRIVKSDGEIAYIKADAIVLRNEQGEPYRMIGINKDITAQKISENKLVEYKHFFQNSNDFLNISNTEGFFEIVNKRMVKTLGYSEKELLGKLYYEVLHPDDVGTVINEVEMLSTHGKTQNFQVRHSKKNGEIIWIEWSVTPDKSNNRIYSIGRDITERKKVSELIKYQFENAPDIILVVNKELIVESINRGFTHLTEEFIGKYCLDFLPEESKSITEQTLKKCFETGKRYEIEHTVGFGRWVRSRFVPMVIDGEINQVMIFGTDITSQKQAEKELKESEEKYRAITENITDAIILVDKEFNLLYRSPANYKITGYTSDDFLNIDVSSLVHKEDLTKSLLHFQEVYSVPNSSSNFKVRILHKQGHWLWVEGSIVNLLDNPSIGAIVMSFRDVSDRIKVEEELALASLIVNSSEDAIFSKTSDNIINSWNHGAESIFGYTAEEIIGQSIYLLIPPDLHEEERRISDTTLKAKPIKYLETQRIRKDGSIIDVSLTISPILNESNQVIGSSKIMRDITSRKKLENERNKVIDDLVQRNRDLEQFSYIVSHNLRAPAANILGISSLIQSLDLISTEKELVSGLAQSAVGLDIVIKDLNYILQKKREVNEKKVCVKFSEIISGIKASIASWIEQENVTLISDFSPLEEMVTIKSYVFSIFYNLITNSIKYRHPERDPVIEIKSHIQKNGFKIVFIDNGLGIDLEKKSDQVFGLYKRFHFHTEGKGMGLYMVKNQLEALGGKISIQSKVNVGTEVTIEFEN